jgi:4-hydroxythreonine-4-phosphate dehydrogenase
LTLAGSFSQACAAQVEQVERAGEAQVIRLDAGQWIDQPHALLRQGTLERARESLGGGQNLLFCIAGAVAQPFSRAPVQAMARLIAPLARLAGACVLTGGDTARAMLTELGVTRLDITGEFEPGIPVGRADSDDLPEFVLKAGGFGDATALQRIMRQFGQPCRPSFARPPAGL